MKPKSPTRKKVENVIRVVIITYIVGVVLFAILTSLYNLIWKGDFRGVSGGRDRIYRMDSLGE